MVRIVILMDTIGCQLDWICCQLNGQLTSTPLKDFLAQIIEIERSTF